MQVRSLYDNDYYPSIHSCASPCDLLDSVKHLNESVVNPIWKERKSLMYYFPIWTTFKLKVHVAIISLQALPQFWI